MPKTVRVIASPETPATQHLRKVNLLASATAGMGAWASTDEDSRTFETVQAVAGVGGDVVAGMKSVFVEGYSAASPSDVATAALLARMDVQPDAARTALISNLITTIESAGILSRLDFLYILAAHDEQAARLNWVSPLHDATIVGAPVFTQDESYQNVSTTGYLNTGFVPATHGVNFTRDDAHFSVWSLTPDQASATVVECGTGETNRTGIGMRGSAFNRAPVALNFTGFSQPTSPTGAYMSLMRRTADVPSDTVLFRNGLNFGVAGQFVTGLSAEEIWIGGRGGMSRKWFMCSGGASLTNQQVLDFYNALLAYKDGV